VLLLEVEQMDQTLLDDIINRLLEVRGRPGKQVQLSESEIRQLCAASREIFLQQPNLLELEAPIKICGNFFLLLFQLAVVAFFFFLTLASPSRNRALSCFGKGIPVLEVNCEGFMLALFL